VNGPVGTPIVRTSNFTFASTAEMKAWAEGKSHPYIYTRYGNPTLAVAEAKLAALEGADAAVVTASGMAAVSSALLAVLRAGDELIATRQLYGGAYRLMRDILPGLGIVVHYVEADLAGAEKLVTSPTRAFYTETPTNPTLGLVDLRKAASFAKQHKLVSLVDNTFATPVLQKPIEAGFDLVVHSATKYLSGHSDVIAGAIIGSASLVHRARQMVIHLGGSMDPGAAFLLVRGLKTLEPRVMQQSRNATIIARFLEGHPKVSRVNYPGLASHPDHKLAKKQMAGFGAMLSFDLKGGLSAARRFCDRLEVFLLAASLGGVESLAILPMYTSHHGLSAGELDAVGVTPGTVRMSVGLENIEDLLADVRRALA
jgi:cystathionine beta-lyase/cystathionine gamma-synthase